MTGLSTSTESRHLPEISRDEHAAVHCHLPPLIDAIKATGSHRDVHTGIVMHTLLSSLSEDEQASALTYLQSVVFWKFV
jgi:hypothetical protein